MIKQCAECGCDFEPNKYTPNQKYCSAECWRKKYFRAYRKTHREEIA